MILLSEKARYLSVLSKALKQASLEATMLLYSSGTDPFSEDLTKLADRVFYFKEGLRDSPRLTAKTGKR